MTANIKPKRTTSSPAGGGQTTTKPKAAGVLTPVTNPFDLWYLCEKAAYAKLTPYRRAKDNHPMYQRTVSQLIRLDNTAFHYRFPYCGEVGFDMSQYPPRPIMSKREPFRPSTFPISQYQQIINKLTINFPQLRVETDLLAKPELESILSNIFYKKSRASGTHKKISGLVRIPDVVRLRTFHNPGEVQYSQGNLSSVIEMKFPGDVMSPAQQMAYQRIAGDPSKLRLLETKQCERGDKKKWREWVRANVSEPVYRPVGQVMSLASRASAEKWKLLIGQIDAEHEVARKHLMFQVPNPGPQMSAAPVNNSHVENQRAVAGIELVLSAPFIAVGAAMTTIAAVPTIATSGGSALVANAGGHSVRFAPLLNISSKKVIAGLAGASTASPAFAEPAVETPSERETHEIIAQLEAWNAHLRHPSTTVQNYVIWEDTPERPYD